MFRQVLVGMLHREATRLTWILSSNATQSDLDIYCQMTAPITTPTGPGLRLTGAEQNDAIWGDATRVSYFSPTPKAASSGREIEYVFASRPAPPKTPCWTPPNELVLTCSEASISVRAVGATLAAPARGGPTGKVANNTGGVGVWSPSTVEAARARVCSLSVDPLSYGWSLAFVAPSARAPGVEWAYENSDVVLQEGAYRWLPTVGF